MSSDDKIRNKGQELKGRAKQKAGDATDNGSLQAEGRRDQA
ncbi:MAG: CsbD family protein, partial [Nonomuraea sp.]|nr:CsbD family protein [Nonomuraea sp.]